MAQNRHSTFRKLPLHKTSLMRIVDIVGYACVLDTLTAFLNDGNVSTKTFDKMEFFPECAVAVPGNNSHDLRCSKVADLVASYHQSGFLRVSKAFLWVQLSDQLDGLR